MIRRVLPALLVLSVIGCDHEVGQDDPPKGQNPIPTQITADLRAVFAVSDQEVYIVGDRGTVARYDGKDVERLQIEGVSETDYLLDVAAAGTGEVVVSGGTVQETPLLLNLHNGTWTVRESPPGVEGFHVQRLMSTLHFQYVSNKRVVLAGGLLRDGYFYGYASGYTPDGNFTLVKDGHDYPLFQDVVGIGATLYFRHSQGILEVADSSSDLQSYEMSTNLLALTEGRDRYLFGFGWDGRFYTMKNGEWSSVESELTSVQALDGRAINDLYAVTSRGGFYHFDGTSWTALDSGTEEHLRDVHVLPNGNVYVVGENGTFFVYVP